jgi:hypothetical protein
MYENPKTGDPMSRDLIIKQLVMLPIRDLARERAVNKTIQKIIDSDNGFFEQWLRSFPSSLNMEDSEDARKFINSLEKWAFEKKELAKVILGIKFCFPRNTNDIERALQYAVYDPSNNNNAALLMLVKSNETHLLKALLADSRVYPSTPRNLALRLSARSGRVDNISLIVHHPRFCRYTPSAIGESRDAIVLAMDDAVAYNQPSALKLLKNIFDEKQHKKARLIEFMQ